MRASNLFQRTLARLRDGERGFALLEVVIAMVIIFLALSVLAYTALVGFRNAGLARQRQVGTAIADKLVEETKGLSWTNTISHGLSDSDLSGDPSIVQCGTTYNYNSCWTRTNNYPFIICLQDFINTSFTEVGCDKKDTQEIHIIMIKLCHAHPFNEACIITIC